MGALVNYARSVDLVRGIARRQPNAPAIEFKGRTIVYGELIDRATRLGAGLLTRGLRRGDRVAILSRNCPEYIEIYLALQIAGLVAVPVNFRLVAGEVSYIVENCGARGMIYSGMYADVVTALQDKAAGLDRRFLIELGDEYEEVLRNSASIDSAPNADAMAPAVIFYTSGTTGFPKGATMSALNVVQRLIALGWELGIGHRDTMLVPGPLFHLSFSFMCLIPLCIGGRSVILDDFQPAEVTDVIGGARITRSFMVPKMFDLLLDEMRHGLRADLSSVRNLLSSGSALGRETFLNLADAFPNAVIAESMGWTESSWIVCCHHEDMLRKENSAGRAAFGAELAILDDEGRELPPGQVGQIYGACPVPFLGYYGNPEATAAMRRGKWETGGDVGYTDDEGFLYILDRKNDMIISGGENVYPAEIERIIGSHPRVSEVAVVGVADANWGEVPRAWVVLRDGQPMRSEEIIAFCEGKLARYKTPKSVVFLDALPRNGMGKILKRELRAKLGETAVGT